MTRYGSNQLVQRVRKDGLDHKSATIAVRCTIRAIRALLLEGCPVTLPQVGRLWFGFRKGRSIHSANPRARMPQVQPDSFPLKFTQSAKLHQQLKNVKPKHQPQRKASPAHRREQEGNPL